MTGLTGKGLIGGNTVGNATVGNNDTVDTNHRPAFTITEIVGQTLAAISFIIVDMELHTHEFYRCGTDESFPNRILYLYVSHFLPYLLYKLTTRVAVCGNLFEHR